MSERHHYPLNGTWSGARKGTGTIYVSHTSIDISVPASHGGVDVGTNPEELLLAAAASCYMITLSILLRNRDIPFVRIDLESEGVVENDGGLRYDRIIHRPTIVLEQAVDETLLYQLAQHAEHTCMVSSALRGNVAVSVEPKIVVNTPSR